MPNKHADNPPVKANEMKNLRAMSLYSRLKDFSGKLIRYDAPTIGRFIIFALRCSIGIVPTIR